MARNRCQNCFKNLPTHVISTVKSHIKQEIQHLQSTEKQPPPQTIKKTQEEKESKDPILDYFTPSDTPNVKTNGVVCSMITNDEKPMRYMDLIGRFTHFPTSGHEYLLVRYNYDANEILVEPPKNRQAKIIADGWENINQQFATAGVQPHTYLLDNEVFNTLKKSFEKYTVNYQLVPPHSNQANKAGCAIHKFKDHFKAGLSTVGPEFPIAHWNLLLTQAAINLNM